jgi:hypothetical protein
MDGSRTTIREMLMKHIDNKCNALFYSMEHKNTSGLYIILFDETNGAQVDTLLVTIDDSLDAVGDWDNADTHFRYHSNEKVNILGIQPRGEQYGFWKKHFAVFMKATLPPEIDTAHLHQPPQNRQNNRAQPSYSDIARDHCHTENYGDVTSPTAA